MGFSILGIGTTVPPNRYSQNDAAEVAKVASCQSDDQVDLLRTLYRQTHIAYRHFIHDQEVYDDFVKGTDETGTRYRPDGPDDFGPDTAERMAMYTREALPMAQR